MSRFATLPTGKPYILEIGSRTPMDTLPWVNLTRAHAIVVVGNDVVIELEHFAYVFEMDSPAEAEAGAAELARIANG